MAALEPHVVSICLDEMRDRFMATAARLVDSGLIADPDFDADAEFTQIVERMTEEAFWTAVQRTR